MPPKIFKKRTYSKGIIIQENKEKDLEKDSDLEKRFKNEEELKNSQRNIVQTRSKLKREYQGMKLSNLNQDELKTGFTKFNNIYFIFLKENLENSNQDNINLGIFRLINRII